MEFIKLYKIEDYNTLKKAFNEMIKPLKDEKHFKQGVFLHYVDKVNYYIEKRNILWMEYLYRIIQWYYEEILKSEIPEEILEEDNKFIEKNKQKIEKISHEKLINEGWTIEEIVKTIVAIGYSTMPGMTEELSGTDEKWIELYKCHTGCFGGLMYRGKIIAEWSMTIIKEKDFKKAMKGKLDDDAIEVYYINKPGFYKIYVEAVAVLKQYRNSKTLGYIMDNFFEVIIKLAKEGYIFTDIVANAYTEEGKVLCKLIDLKYICDHHISGEMYYKKNFPIEKESYWNKKYPEIIKEYCKYEKIIRIKRKKIKVLNIKEKMKRYFIKK